MESKYWELYFDAVKNKNWQQAVDSLNAILKTEPKNPQVLPEDWRRLSEKRRRQPRCISLSAVRLAFNERRLHAEVACSF